MVSIALSQKRRKVVASIAQSVAATLMLPSQLSYSQSSNSEITIVAASDLQFVLPELVKQYNAPGIKIQLRFGASGTLATQIIRGLTCDVFLSADAAQVERVKTAGFAASEPFVYAKGHIAVASLSNSSIAVDDQLVAAKNYFDRELALGRQPKLAIANPLHAPYGQAAQQAIETLGLWAYFKPHLVMGESVAQAAQFVASGSAAVGIIGVALCRASVLSPLLKCKELPQSLHKPILQTAVALKHPNHAGDEAGKFLTFLRSPAAQALLIQHGFTTQHL